MATTYTHHELNQDVAIGIGGYYTPQHEVRLKHNGRDVLYISGRAVTESSCCGTGDWAYAIVPGYILNWQSSRNERGMPVTEVEPIRDSRVQQDIRQTIQDSEDTSMIGFW